MGLTEVVGGISGVVVGVVAFFLVMTRVDDWLWDLAFVRNDLRKAAAWELAVTRKEFANADAEEHKSGYKASFLFDMIVAGLGAVIGLAQRVVKLSPAGYVVEIVLARRSALASASH
jgi:cytochrome b subunit of formate dehydrogenase